MTKNFKRLEEGVDEKQLFVYKQWSDQGLSTSFANYTVFLSLLAKDKQNSVKIPKKCLNTYFQ